MQHAGPALVIPPALRDRVASVHGLRSAGAAHEILLTQLPTCASQLVVHVTPDGNVRTSVAGPRTLARYKRIIPGPFYVQFILQPDAARAVFGVPVHDLADRVVELEDLWGPNAREVSGRVARCCDDPQAAAFAIAELLARPIIAAAAAGARGARLARRASEALATTDPDQVSIRALAGDLGVSERSLRQAFRDHVGVSPKRYARIARIRRVVAEAGRERWARLAVDHGFYDQAHLNAEFRALLAVSPREFVAQRFPLARPRSSATTA